MWSDQDRLFLMSTPRYLKVSTSSSTELPSDRVCPFCTGDFFLDRIMYLHFVGFNCRRCSSDQPLIILISDCTARKSSATLTELSEYTLSYVSNIYLTVVLIHIHSAPGTVYNFRVQAETTVGGGPFSSSRNFTTSENGKSLLLPTNVKLDLNLH